MRKQLKDSILMRHYSFSTEAECLFTQKWSELFSPATIHTYQYRLRNTHSILQEIKMVLRDVKNDLISIYNLQDLISESRKHLENDICLKKNDPALLDILLKSLTNIKKNDHIRPSLLKLEYRVNYALAKISKQYIEYLKKDLKIAISPMVI